MGSIGAGVVGPTQRMLGMAAPATGVTQDPVGGAADAGADSASVRAVPNATIDAGKITRRVHGPVVPVKRCEAERI
jgi:hypothetical protein